jgi:hypothetical protein
MSQQNLKITCRPFIYDDFESYLWIHQHQKPSMHPFDEGFFTTQGVTPRYFKSLVDEYHTLSEDHDAFILGAFDESNALCGIGELITLSDDYSLAQIKIKVFNLYFDQGFELKMIKQLVNIAKDKQYKKLVAYHALQDEISISLFKEAGFTDEGAQMIAECDQVCWPTKHVFSYILQC